MIACFDTADTLIGLYDAPCPGSPYPGGACELVLHQVEAFEVMQSDPGAALNVIKRQIRIPVETYEVRTRIDDMVMVDLRRRLGWQPQVTDLIPLLPRDKQALLTLPLVKTSLMSNAMDMSTTLLIRLPVARIPADLAEEIFDHREFTPA